MIDPDDTEALTVIGNSSYNELMTRLIDYQESAPPTTNTVHNNNKQIHDNNIEQVLIPEKKSEGISEDLLVFDDHNVIHISEKVGSMSLSPPDDDDKDHATDITPSQANTTLTNIPTTTAVVRDTSFPPPPPPTPVSACDLDLSPADVIHPTDLNQIPTDLNLNPADIIQHFLSSTSSQLTTTGLQRLHTCMSDRELAVIFRNNHFSTLFSYEGSLYTLVTDIGYLHIPRVVWEKLDTVDGYV